MVPIWYRDLKYDYLIPWSLHIHPQLHLLYSYSDYTALLSVFDCFTYMYFYTLSFFHPCTYIHMSNSFFSWAARNERGPASVALLQVSLFFLKGFSKFFLAWFEGLWTEGLTPVHILKRVKQQCWAFCFFTCMQRHNATLILVWLLTQSQILVRENKSIWCWSTKSFMKKEIEFVTAHIFFICYLFCGTIVFYENTGSSSINLVVTSCGPRMHLFCFRELIPFWVCLTRKANVCSDNPDMVGRNHLWSHSMTFPLHLLKEDHARKCRNIPVGLEDTLTMRLKRIIILSKTFDLSLNMYEWSRALSYISFNQECFDETKMLAFL